MHKYTKVSIIVILIIIPQVINNVQGIIVHYSINKDDFNAYTNISIKLHGNGAKEIYLSSQIPLENICNAYNVSYISNATFTFNYLSKNRIWNVHNLELNYKYNFNMSFYSIIDINYAYEQMNAFLNIFKSYNYEYHYIKNTDQKYYFVYGNLNNTEIILEPLLNYYSGTVLFDIIKNIDTDNILISLSQTWSMTAYYKTIENGTKDIKLSFNSLFNVSKGVFSDKILPAIITYSAIARDLKVINKSNDLEYFNFQNDNMFYFSDYGFMKQLKYEIQINTQGTFDLPYITYRGYFGNFPMPIIYRNCDTNIETNHPAKISYSVANIGYDTAYNITINDKIPVGMTLYSGNTSIVISEVKQEDKYLQFKQVDGFEISSNQVGTYSFPLVVNFTFQDKSGNVFVGRIIYNENGIDVIPEPNIWLIYSGTLGFLVLLIIADIYRIKTKNKRRGI